MAIKLNGTNGIVLSTSGNLTNANAENIIQTGTLNGNAFVGVALGPDGNAFFSNHVVVNTDLIPFANATQSLGNATHQWANLWVANNTIYLGNVAIGLNASNVLTVGGEPVVLIAANNVANIGNFIVNQNALQNINGGTFNNGDLDSGATALLALPTNGDSNAVSLLNYYGSIAITAADSPGTTKTWTFGSTGNLTTPGNITVANVVTANTFVSNAFNVVTAGNLSITSQYGLGFTGTILEDNGTLELIANGGGAVVVGWDSTYGNGLGNIATVNFNEVGGEGILLRTGNRAATEYNWNFDNSGNLTLPGNIAGNTGGFTIGYRDIPQVTFSANATAALADAGKHYYSTTAGNLALTLPDNANVALPTGATLTVVVNAAGNVLVNQAAGVTLYQAGSSTTGNRVVGAYGLASVMKVAANTWVISGTGVY